MSKELIICRICDHPFKDGEEIIRVYEWDRGTTADDYPKATIHLKCLLDPRGYAR